MAENNNDRKTIIDKKTLLPIGFVISIVMVVWFVATLNANVSANTEDIKDRPTRVEFNAMKDDLSEIKDNVNSLVENAMLKKN